MRFEVPQFIEVEDKIVGPFTWKQFIYVAGGIGVGVVSFLVLPVFLFALIGVPIMVLAGFLAFHPINNRPFSIFLESFFQYTTSKKLYLWKRDSEQTIHAQASQKMPTQVSAAPLLPKVSKEGMGALSNKLLMDTLEKEPNI